LRASGLCAGVFYGLGVADALGTAWDGAETLVVAETIEESAVLSDG
jgi:hypothetical protein